MSPADGAMSGTDGYAVVSQPKKLTGREPVRLTDQQPCGARAMDQNRIIRPNDAVPVSVDDFLFAMQVGMAAGSFRMPMVSPTEYGFTIETADDQSHRLQLADHPLNRFGLAVREHFAGDHALFKSFMWRWFALLNVLELQDCKPYIQREPNASFKLIHSSVLTVAATEPLQDDGEFDHQQFFARVAEAYAADPT